MGPGGILEEPDDLAALIDPVCKGGRAPRHRQRGERVAVFQEPTQAPGGGLLEVPHELAIRIHAKHLERLGRHVKDGVGVAVFDKAMVCPIGCPEPSGNLAGVVNALRPRELRAGDFERAQRAPGNKPTVSPLMIPLVYCHINSFQRASRVEKPWPGGEKRRDGQASHHVEL